MTADVVMQVISAARLSGIMTIQIFNRQEFGFWFAGLPYGSEEAYTADGVKYYIK